MAEVKHWSSTDERGTILGMKFLFLVYRFFGRRVLWLFLFPVVFFIFMGAKPARQASKKFFKRVYRVKGGDKPGFITSVKHFMTFADSAFDKIDARLGRITHQQMRFNDESVLPKLIESKKGAIFIASHLGNIEVCRVLGQGKYQATINVLVFTENAVKFNKILDTINDNADVNLIQVSAINPILAIELKEKVDNGEIVIIVGDRTSVKARNRNIYVDFLGHPAAFSQGPFVLASLLECPVYWMFCLKEKRGFNMVFEHVSERIILPRKQRQAVLENLVNTYSKTLGEYAVRYPYQWFNFYDFWQNDELLVRN